MPATMNVKEFERHVSSEFVKWRTLAVKHGITVKCRPSSESAYVTEAFSRTSNWAGGEGGFGTCVAEMRLFLRV